MPAPVATLSPEDLMQTAVYLVSQTAVAAESTPTSVTGQTQDWPATHTLAATSEVSSTSETSLPPIVTQDLKLTLTSTPEATQIPTIERSPTRPLVTLTPTGWCNAVGQGTIFDITIPDGTEMLPGQTFIKTWRLINTGTCKWSRLYKLVFYSGNSMGAYQEQLFGGEVQPGQAVDISVQLTAPMLPGEYQSNWMLMDSNGNYFGMGWNADAPFWANIYVVEELSATPTP